MPTPPIAKFERDGSVGQRLICIYKRAVPPGIRVKLENWLKRTYSEYIHRIRWISDTVIRIVLKRKCICEAGALCVEQALSSKAGP